MKQPLTILLFVAVFTSTTTYAEPMCDVSCDFTINYTTAGSIEAVEALTFTFGSNGVLQLGAAGTINTSVQPGSIDYSAGGELTLAAGDSIDFDAGGVIYLGEGGNIDFSVLIITTNDEVIISGEESITISSITLIGDGGLSIISAGSILSSGIITAGSLKLVAETSIDVNSSVDSLSVTSAGEVIADDVINSCLSSASVDGSVIISTGVTSLEPVITCTDTITATGGVIGDVGIISGSGDITLVNGEAGELILAEPVALEVSETSLVIDEPSADVTEFNLAALTAESLIELEGIQLPTSDGNNCTVNSGKCITADGVTYVVMNGELILAGDGGQIGIVTLLTLLVFITGLRRQRVFCIRKC